MASLVSHTLAASSPSSLFPRVDQSQSTAASRRLVIATAKPEEGRAVEIIRRAMTDSDAKRPPVFGIKRSDLVYSKDPALERWEGEGKPNRSGLTADKARVLRKKLRAMESWHDAMYHSAIASRLACPDYS